MEAFRDKLVKMSGGWCVVKLIGYAGVSTARQISDRQVMDLVVAGVRRDDLYIDQRASGIRLIRPELGKALAAVQAGYVGGEHVG